MSLEVFTQEWSRACCERLNQSEGYRAAGAEWEWPVVLVMTASPADGIAADRAFHLDLHRGACRGVRAATAEDLAEAPYVMSADPPTWRRILGGELEPVSALMGGRLKLVRGSLFVLARHTASARAIVAAAAEVGGVFPAPPASTTETA